MRSEHNPSPKISLKFLFRNIDFLRICSCYIIVEIFELYCFATNALLQAVLGDSGTRDWRDLYRN